MGLQAWADANVLKPATMAWLLEQHERLQTLVGRCLEHERWLDWPDTPPYITPCAADILALLEAAFAELFKLDIPLHSDVVCEHLGALAQSAQRYGNAVAAELDDPRLCIQPPPPLTRYKTALSEVARTTDSVYRCAQRPMHCSLQDSDHTAMSRRSLPHDGGLPADSTSPFRGM